MKLHINPFNPLATGKLLLPVVLKFLTRVQSFRSVIIFFKNENDYFSIYMTLKRLSILVFDILKRKTYFFIQ